MFKWMRSSSTPALPSSLTANPPGPNIQIATSFSTSPTRGPWVGPVPARRPPKQSRVEVDPAARLHRAVWDCDYAGVDALVRRKGVGVEALNFLGQTPLFVAAYTRDAGMVRHLLELGADPNGLCHGGYTAVHGACFSGSGRILAMILKSGGDLDKLDFFRKTPVDWGHDQPDAGKKSKALDVIEQFRLLKMAEEKAVKHDEAGASQQDGKTWTTFAATASDSAYKKFRGVADSHQAGSSSAAAKFANYLHDSEDDVGSQKRGKARRRPSVSPAYSSGSRSSASSGDHVWMRTARTLDGDDQVGRVKKRLSFVDPADLSGPSDKPNSAADKLTKMQGTDHQRAFRERHRQVLKQGLRQDRVYGPSEEQQVKMNERQLYRKDDFGKSANDFGKKRANARVSDHGDMRSAAEQKLNDVVRPVEVAPSSLLSARQPLNYRGAPASTAFSKTYLRGRQEVRDPPSRLPKPGTSRPRSSSPNENDARSLFAHDSNHPSGWYLSSKKQTTSNVELQDGELELGHGHKAKPRRYSEVTRRSCLVVSRPANAAPPSATSTPNEAVDDQNRRSRSRFPFGRAAVSASTYGAGEFARAMESFDTDAFYGEAYNSVATSSRATGQSYYEVEVATLQEKDSREDAFTTVAEDTADIVTRDEDEEDFITVDDTGQENTLLF